MILILIIIFIMQCKHLWCSLLLGVPKGLGLESNYLRYLQPTMIVIESLKLAGHRAM
jgi:hypothetical protein